jgi:parallel beta-helix repeat protein
MQGAVKFSLNQDWRGRFFSVILLCGFAVAGQGATYTVTTTADNGNGSFRQAILNANANSGTNSIIFQISGTPPFTIMLASVLPSITAPVVIDATTQLGFAGKPVIGLNGASTGANAGLRFVAGSSTLRGMAMNHFPAQNIELDSASNSIQGNFIGTDVTGTLALGSGSLSDGIDVKSSGNLIGGTNSGDGNVISGGNNSGIYIANANDNTVQGNLIGVAASGTTSLGNLNNGIVIYGSSSGNVIGGPTAAARNIISGNGASGIFLNSSTAAGNLIQGNFIGTDISGSNALANVAGDGVTLNGAAGNTVSSNLISGNGLAGVSIGGAGATGNVVNGNFIGTDVNGKTSLGNHYQGVNIFGTSGNQIGGTNAGAGNVISGNVQDGILLTESATGNLIQGNLIGLSASGTNALHNGDNGITFSNASSNLVGGTVIGAQNVISGNFYNGIAILTVTDTLNTICGNYIGTDVTGTKAIANTLAGVRIQGCSNMVGGVTAGSGNVISGNGQIGIWLVGSNGSVAGNLVQGNLIGLDTSGINGLANGTAGIGISGAAGNQIGGTTSGARNVISANEGWGIFLITNGASGNQVQGNFIGTDVSGTLARGNLYDGIYLQQAGTNLIGGSVTGAGNLISANSNRGIWLTNSSWNMIQGNFIGTQADGTNALGNVWHGIDIDVNSTNNTIGGAAVGAGNRIAFAQSGYAGVRVRTGALNNLISGNSIFSNGALGIDLSPPDGSANSGVNPIMDCESGIAANAANAGQNFPTLSNVYDGGTITLIRGTMDGKTGKTYALQFFASPVGDSSDYGEGQVFLGQTNVTLGSLCSSNLAIYLPVSVPTGWVMTATATDTANNTSEFSDWVSILPVPSPKMAVTGHNQISISWTNNGGSFALQQTRSLTAPIQWTIVTNVPALINNFLVTTLASTNASVFYRLTPQ